MSESFGRRQIYVITGTLHALLFLPQILVKNIAVIVVMRLLQGCVLIIIIDLTKLDILEHAAQLVTPLLAAVLPTCLTPTIGVSQWLFSHCLPLGHKVWDLPGVDILRST